MRFQSFLPGLLKRPKRLDPKACNSKFLTPNTELQALNPRELSRSVALSSPMLPRCPSSQHVLGVLPLEELDAVLGDRLTSEVAVGGSVLLRVGTMGCRGFRTTLCKAVWGLYTS